MKHIYRIMFISSMFIGLTLPSLAQNRDNEDEVTKVDAKASRFVYKPGEVLVKFKSTSPVSVTSAKGMFKAASIDNVNSLLHEFGVEEMTKLLPNENPKRTLRRANAYGGGEVDEVDMSQVYFIKIKSQQMDTTQILVDKLKTLNEVEYAEPNYKVYTLGESSPTSEINTMQSESISTSSETDSAVICNMPQSNPLYSQQWGIAAVGLDKVWKKPIINKKRPVIAILDTGVDIYHPDLINNIWTNTKENNGTTGYDDDNNGFTDDIHGWDFINNTDSITDYNSHGTHVAGIAAACNNEVGVVGANPQALIMPVTVFQSDGSGDIATIIKGINYAVTNGATILNMSFGTYANSIALKQALAKAYQSAVLVAAVGNDGLAIYLGCGIPSGTMYPAGYSFVLGVQASGDNGNLLSWSNHDCDGPTYSEMGEDGVNYELSAPGSSIISSVPNGNYKLYNGTSMATPLVAGGISALQMTKDYASQEILWGDIIHSTSSTNVIDFNKAYDITSRPAELDLLSIEYNDSLDGGNGDGQPDAGETLRLYPTIRTTWGEAKNIKMNLTTAEYEDTNLITVQNNNVDFGYNLSSYAKEKSLNPIIIKINKNIADGRKVKLVLKATCDNNTQEISYEFTVIVNNVVKIGGMLTKDTILTADKHYLVYSDLAVPEGVTLTIEPGTTVKFNTNTGISSSGKLIIKGTPEKPIKLTGNGDYWNGINSQDTLEYCKIEYCSNINNNTFYLKNCEWLYGSPLLHAFTLVNSNAYYNDYHRYSTGGYWMWGSINSNIVDNSFDYPMFLTAVWGWNGHEYENIFNYHGFNIFNNYNASDNKYLSIGFLDMLPVICDMIDPIYLGTSKENIARKSIYELGNLSTSLVLATYAWINLDNMSTRPSKQAHGIVWKVVVDGYDAQDEYDSLPPLGVGKHKFEVYFNRAMDTSIAPNIAMGVRSPYTQTMIAEDGSWSNDSTVYTAYLMIKGKSAYDGINTIYVDGAKDNEHFEIPYENVRFHVNVQAAGSLSTGFMGTAGLGKVSLTWDNSKNHFSDFLGYNVYRYTMVNDSVPSEAIRINKTTLNDTTTCYTDYNVVPGKTYYYFYKVISTDLKENDPSNVVAVTPVTATKGDANGSMSVDVADVVSVVNYAIGQKPEPFIFDAADVNGDKSIDILDVIGVIKIILNPNEAKDMSIESTAKYTVEDGILYVESPVELSGVQVRLNVPDSHQITAESDLEGFENASAWLDSQDYLFLAYSMKGKTLSVGKHALLNIGDAAISQIALSDSRGVNVLAINGDATGIKTGEAMQFEHPYPNPFKSQLTIPYIIGKEGTNRVEIDFYDISGRMIDKYVTTVNGMGKYSYVWMPKQVLCQGLYFVTLRVNGTDMQTTRVIYEK